MADYLILRDIGLLITGAAVLLFATRRLRVPPILAYMIAGLLLGPLTGLVAVTEPVELFAEVGVALLLFVVGLEMSLQTVRDLGRPAAIAGVVQVLVTTALGGGLALLLGFPPTVAVFLGLATAFSSTVVVIKLLDRAGDLTVLYGRLAVGILLIQDVLVAIVLTFVSGLGSGGGFEPDLGTVSAGLATAFGGMLAMAAVAALAVWKLLPRLFAWLQGSSEALLIASLTWCFAFILAAEALHVSIELGAFIAGVALAQLPDTEPLRRRVHPLVNFFLAIFFVALGVQMDLAPALGHLLPAIVLSVFVLLGKPTLIALLLARMRYPAVAAFRSGVTLGQVSEFSFILIGLAIAAGILEPEILSLLGLMGLITIGVSSAVVPRVAGLAAALRVDSLLERLGAGPPEPAPPPPRTGHVVVIGMNTLGRMLVDRLHASGEDVLAVDTDAGKLTGLDVDTLHGSIESESVLEEAGVERARLVVSALRIEDANSLLVFRCRELGVPVSVHAFDPSLVDELTEMGADHLMVSKHEGVRRMEEEFRRIGVGV